MFKYFSQRIKNFFTDSSKRSSIEKNILNRKVNFDIIIEDDDEYPTVSVFCPTAEAKEDASPVYCYFERNSEFTSSFFC